MIDTNQIHVELSNQNYLFVGGYIAGRPVTSVWNLLKNFDYNLGVFDVFPQNKDHDLAFQYCVSIVKKGPLQPVQFIQGCCPIVNEYNLGLVLEDQAIVRSIYGLETLVSIEGQF